MANVNYADQPKLAFSIFENRFLKRRKKERCPRSRWLCGNVQAVIAASLTST